MKYTVSLLFFLLLLFRQQGISQDEPIMLTNPSFEGTPAEGNKGSFHLSGWQDCGFPGQTVPDIHPKSDGGQFQVTQTPFDGNTYIGMVVREDSTWEVIAQRLSKPLEAGKCYEFSINLCRSETYISPSEKSGKEENYATPARLRIWGGSGFCTKGELLDESSSVVNTRWLGYNFNFSPKQTHNYIVFEVYYNTGSFRYNGNILLDNAGPIFPVPCKVEKPEVADLPKKEKILKELDRSSLKRGQTIRIDQLFFKADSAGITEESYAVLDEMYDFLAENTDVTVEIGGHTNSIPSDEYCDRLSTERAKAVADYLSEKGISRDRLQYKGYGKREPIDTNKTAYGRKRNQRVEIKILSFNG